jgi:hypothetical protein
MSSNIFYVANNEPENVPEEIYKFITRMVDEATVSGTLLQAEDLNKIEIHLTEEEDIVKLYDRIVEEYFTMGHDIDENIDLFGLAFASTNRIADQMFMNMRANQLHYSIEAIADICNEDGTEVDKAMTRMDLIESIMEANGTSKMLSVINVLVKALHANNIEVVDEVNTVLLEKLH